MLQRERYLLERTNGGGCPTAPPTTMKIISWNCCGLGNPWAVRDLNKLIQQKVPNLVFLMETRKKIAKNLLAASTCPLAWGCSIDME